MPSKKKSVFYYRYRSSINGHFVSAEYAQQNPDTTQRTRIRRKGM